MKPKDLKPMFKTNVVGKTRQNGWWSDEVQTMKLGDLIGSSKDLKSSGWIDSKNKTK